MARVSLRTVAPAKLSACQSDEKACTLAKPSLVISSMLRAASGIQNRMARFRTREKPR